MGRRRKHSICDKFDSTHRSFRGKIRHRRPRRQLNHFRLWSHVMISQGCFSYSATPRLLGPAAAERSFCWRKNGKHQQNASQNSRGLTFQMPWLKSWKLTFGIRWHFTCWKHLERKISCSALFLSTKTSLITEFHFWDIIVNILSICRPLRQFWRSGQSDTFREPTVLEGAALVLVPLSPKCSLEGTQEVSKG